MPKIKKNVKEKRFDNVEAINNRRGHWTISKLNSSRGPSNIEKKDLTYASHIIETILEVSEGILLRSIK